MPLHKIFDKIVDCDILIPELPLLTTGKADIKIASKHQGKIDWASTRWIHEWKDEKGETNLICGRHDEDYVLSFPDGCDFLLSPTHGSIHYFAHNGAPMVTIRHMLLDQVLPRFFAHQGHLVLHASAIRLPDGRGIVFSGPSGSGKSTLAASFSENGAHLLADDCLIVQALDNNVTACTSYNGLRLYDDSRHATVGRHTQSWGVAHYTDKRRIRVYQDTSTTLLSGVPIDAIFILQDNKADNVQISLANGMKPAIDLLGQLFVLDVTDVDATRRNLGAVTKLLNRGVSIYNLDYPWDYAYLNKIRKCILGKLEHRQPKTESFSDYD